MTTSAGEQHNNRWKFFALLLLHQAAAYLVVRLCVPYLAFGAAHIPSVISGITDWTQLLYAHLFLFSVVPAFFIALLLNRPLRHHSAVYVWIIPTVVFGYEFIFASPTVYPTMIIQSDFASAFRMWVGDGFHSRVNGYYQFTFTAPLYVGVAYSLGAWLGYRWSKAAKPVAHVPASA